MADMKVTKCLYEGCGWEWVSHYDDGAVMLLDHLLACPVALAKIAANEEGLKRWADDQEGYLKSSHRQGQIYS